MASNVEKRMARALPVFRIERFCGVIPTASARSFNRFFRIARTTSRLMMMGMASNSEGLFLLNLARVIDQPADEENRETGKKAAHAGGQRSRFRALKSDLQAQFQQPTGDGKSTQHLDTANGVHGEQH